MALQENKELYTKNQIAEHFPELRKYLFREENVNLNDLQKGLLYFVELLKTRSLNMKKTFEYRYKKKTILTTQNNCAVAFESLFKGKN
jgi:hypothetical protein